MPCAGACAGAVCEAVATGEGGVNVATAEEAAEGEAEAMVVVAAAATTATRTAAAHRSACQKRVR